MNSNPSKSSYSEVDNPSSNLPKQSQIKKKKKNHKKVHKMLSSTYKKKKCEFYNRGSCSKGAHCTFSHNFIPDVAKVNNIKRRKYVNFTCLVHAQKEKNACIPTTLKDIHANFTTFNRLARRDKIVDFLIP